MYKCTECNKKFAQRKALLSHMYSHLPAQGRARDRFRCMKCNKRFNERELLGNHMINAHSKHRICECEYCGRLFFTQHFHDRHVLKIHANQEEKEQANANKPFSCGECKTSFSTNSGLNYHLTFVHGPEGFQCEVCEVFFRHKKNLLKHKCVTD